MLSAGVHESHAANVDEITLGAASSNCEILGLTWLDSPGYCAEDEGTVLIRWESDL